MIELLFIYQLARNPLQAIGRRWYCRSLYRASRGRRQCSGCTGSWCRAVRSGVDTGSL